MNSSEIFLNSFKDLPLSADQREQVAEIAKNIEADLCTNIHGYFHDQTMIKIIMESASRLKTKLKVNNFDVPAEWNQIVASFHHENHWGYPMESGGPPPPPPTEEQKIRRELLPYIWALIQAVVIMK